MRPLSRGALPGRRLSVVRAGRPHSGSFPLGTTHGGWASYLRASSCQQPPPPSLRGLCFCSVAAAQPRMGPPPARGRLHVRHRTLARRL
eukprot:13576655-Alexandrium_andersonii.AAC.1